MITNLDITAFSYEAFDRQLTNFCRMLNVMMDGWEDYSSQEMTFDINSLCIKASRLCYMADQDLALQHSDVSHQRKQINEVYQDTFHILTYTTFAQFMTRIVKGVREGKKVEGHKSPMFASEMSSIFPKLTDLLRMEGMSYEEMEVLRKDIIETEAAIRKYKKLTKFPGVRYEERLWHLIRLYAMTCYLHLHFRRVCEVTNQDISHEEAGRLTELAVQKYINEEDSQKELELYFANLRYDNDNLPLNESQLLTARRALKDLVPEKLKLSFLKYAADLRQLGSDICDIDFTADEFLQLIGVEAKYQLITQQIFELQHPEKAIPSLPNEVFCTMVGGRPVDMKELRESISKMVNLVSKKNHWFCVWSVLKHLNLIKPDSTFATFAHQMMTHEWFGDIEQRLHFTADNLSDYSHYFAEYDYTEWNKPMFLEKKALYGMKKWSDKLFDTFSSLCGEMMRSIWGYRFLGESK